MLTRLGKVTFQVPPVCSGDFYSSALEKGTRTDQATHVALTGMYVQGVSTRRVIEVLQRLPGPEIALSSRQVSRAAAKLDEELKTARRAVLPVVPWQRCQFHLQQNAGQFVTHQKARKSVAAQLRAIFNAPDWVKAERLFKTTLDSWRKAHPKLAQLAEEAVPESLTVFDFPAAHCVRLCTTNGLERINRELSRRTRVASIFPNPDSCLRFVSALLAELDDEWMTGKVYLNLNP